MKLKYRTFRRPLSHREIVALAGSVPPGRCIIRIIDEPPIFMTENGRRLDAITPKFRRYRKPFKNFKFNRARRQKP